MEELESRVASVSRKKLIKAVLELLTNQSFSSDHIALNRKVFEDQIVNKTDTTTSNISNLNQNEEEDTKVEEDKEVSNVKNGKSKGKGRNFNIEK
mmetsp:Transcript_22541/g.32391  ORF Transcript_22541/g.32391 Transcript_22541/m.32391 type:complete len:95 (-) Transcript_22541:2243-2527(-)